MRLAELQEIGSMTTEELEAAQKLARLHLIHGDPAAQAVLTFIRVVQLVRQEARYAEQARG